MVLGVGARHCQKMSEEIEETYCRLCAEPTPMEQLISHDAEDAVFADLTGKCSKFNVDMSPENQLPKTVCFACFDMLGKTFAFLMNTRSAQTKLYSIYAKKLQLPPGCEIKPVTKNCNEVTLIRDVELKDEKEGVKLEVTIDVAHTIDPANLLNLDRIKKEPELEDYDHVFGSGFNSAGSDSDQPLKMAAKRKKKEKKPKRRKKMKNRVKIKEMKEEEDLDVPEEDLIPNPDAVAIPLDMSLYNASWLDYEWRCAKCSALCKDLASLRLHSLHMHKCCCVFKCSDCDKIIANHKSFVNHVRLHNKPLRYCCELCNKHFPKAQLVKRHRNTEHRLALLTICQNCGASFETQEQLQDHILLYAKGYRRRANRKKEKLEENLKCQFCEKEFKSRSNLQAHKLVHSERARNFSCHVCGKMFFTKGTLGTHMMTHEDTKPFKCDYCPMAFRARGNLLSHVSLHSGMKPFVCEQCGKSFRVKRHLKSHLIVHTDLMPFSCEYCGKPFRFKTRLNLHLRQHTGAKPYSCLQCQRDFTNGSNYKKHMKRRHNIDTGKKKFVDTLQNELDIPFPMPQELQKFEDDPPVT